MHACLYIPFLSFSLSPAPTRHACLASSKGGKPARGDARDAALHPCHCDALAARGIAWSVGDDAAANAAANATKAARLEAAGLTAWYAAATLSDGCGEVSLPTDRDCSMG